MATKSILKNVDIKNKKFGKQFADAMEKAMSTPDKDVKYTRPYREAKGEEIKKFFD